MLKKKKKTSKLVIALHVTKNILHDITCVILSSYSAAIKLFRNTDFSWSLIFKDSGTDM